LRIRAIRIVRPTSHSRGRWVAPARWLGRKSTLAVVLGLIALACGGKTAQTAQTANSGAPTAEFRVVRHQTWSVRQPEVDQLSILGGDQIAFPFASGADGVPDEAEVLDTRTGTTRVVARTSWPQGVIGWSTGTGDYFVWLDMSRVPDDSNGSAAWKLHDTNVTTGRDLLLAQSALPQAVFPLARAADGRVVWVQQSEQSTSLFFADLATARAKRLVLNVIADGVDVVNNHTVVLANGGPGRSNIELIDTSSLRSTRLTRNGLGTQPRANDGWISWAEFGRGSSGDPQSVWLDDFVGRGRPVEVAKGENRGNAVPGPGWAAWYPQADAVQLGQPGRSAVTLGHSIAVTTRISAAGNSLVFGSFPTGPSRGPDLGSTILNLVTVARSQGIPKQ